MDSSSHTAPELPVGLQETALCKSQVSEASGIAQQAGQTHLLIFCLVQVIVSGGQAKAGLVHLWRDLG